MYLIFFSLSILQSTLWDALSLCLFLFCSLHALVFITGYKCLVAVCIPAKCHLRGSEISHKCTPSIWMNSPYSALRIIDTAVVFFVINFDTSDLNIRPEPAAPSVDSIVTTNNHIEWYDELSSPDCIRYSYTYIPVKSVRSRHSSRTH